MLVFNNCFLSPTYGIVKAVYFEEERMYGRSLLARLKQGILVGVIPEVLIILIWNIVASFFELKKLTDIIPGPKITDLAIILAVQAACLLLADLFVEKASADQPLLKLLAEFVPPLRITLLIKRSGGKLQSVEFLDMEGGHGYGVLMSTEPKISVITGDEIFPVWELRPGSFWGGKLRWFKRGIFKEIEEDGMKLYKDIVLGYGIPTEKTEN